MLPAELNKPAPRDISFNHELFSKNRKKIKSIFLGSMLILPLVIFIFWWKFDDIYTGIYVGVGIAVLVELMALALYINTTKAVELFKNGVATIGVVESMQAPADREGNAYITLRISYADKQGMSYSGNIVMIGKAAEADKKEGDQVAVLFMEDKPQLFAMYSPGIGISMSRSKPVN